MSERNDEQTLEVTEEQIAMLRELGVSEPEIEGLDFAAADELISELRAMREDAGRIGRT